MVNPEVGQFAPTIASYSHHDTTLHFLPPQDSAYVAPQPFHQYSADIFTAWMQLNTASDIGQDITRKAHFLTQQAIITLLPDQLMPYLITAPEYGYLRPTIVPEFNLYRSNGHIKTTDITFMDPYGCIHIIEISNQHKGAVLRTQCHLLESSFPYIQVFGWTAAYFTPQKENELYIEFKLKHPRKI